MPYKILKAPDGRWGEGWKEGDIVDFDIEAAKVPLQNGEIIEVPNLPLEEVVEVIERPEFICGVCGKVCKNKLGLTAHKRSHK